MWNLCPVRFPIPGETQIKQYIGKLYRNKKSQKPRTKTTVNN